MEFIKPQAEEVLSRIDEIRKYYDAWEATNGGTSLISRPMLAFTLGLDTVEEVDRVLEMLGAQTVVLGAQGDLLRLAPRDVDAAG